MTLMPHPNLASHLIGMLAICLALGARATETYEPQLIPKIASDGVAVGAFALIAWAQSMRTKGSFRPPRNKSEAALIKRLYLLQAFGMLASTAAIFMIYVPLRPSVTWGAVALILFVGGIITDAVFATLYRPFIIDEVTDGPIS